MCSDERSIPKIQNEKNARVISRQAAPVHSKAQHIADTLKRLLPQNSPHLSRSCCRKCKSTDKTPWPKTRTKIQRPTSPWRVGLPFARLKGTRQRSEVFNSLKQASLLDLRILKLTNAIWSENIYWPNQRLCITLL